jgi:drug/metabolite transporter (DMT)-like permease
VSDGTPSLERRYFQDFSRFPKINKRTLAVSDILHPMNKGIAIALVSAALFGASTPLAKLLLGVTDPWLLAGLLYLGAGFGLGVVLFLQRIRNIARTQGRISRADVPWLAAAIAAGGVAGPVFLMLGLAQTSASSASLLLNLEGLATMGIAWIVFKESVDLRLLTGAAAILAGAAVLGWQGGPAGFGPGSLFIALACLGWGIDNNLTRKVSAADPLQIAALKGLIARPINFVIAMSLGADMPAVSTIAASALVGFFGYGVSLAMFVLALRHLGAARTGAYFSTAPFVGAAIGVFMLSDALSAELCIAGVLMAVGVWLHVTEKHEHEHVHEPLGHDHAHTHYEHHQHAHGTDDPEGELHTHWHEHPRLVHKHPHYPDLHHQHSH